MKVLDFILTNTDYSQDLITRSTYHSNAIEGSTLTYAETYAILFNDNNFKINNKEPIEIYEAINHKKALQIIFNYIKDNENCILIENLIKNINSTINENIKEVDGYRKVQVFIRGSEHLPPEPNKILNLMNYFVYNYNNDLNDIYTKIATYHINFESIHPFEDGNGRTGRILINYELLKNNLPPIVIDKESRIKYFELLRTNNISDLAKWFYELSQDELDRMKKFGFKQN